MLIQDNTAKEEDSARRGVDKLAGDGEGFVVPQPESNTFADFAQSPDRRVLSRAPSIRYSTPAANHCGRSSSLRESSASGRLESGRLDYLGKPVAYDLFEFFRVKWLEDIGLCPKADGTNGKIFRFGRGDDHNGELLVGLSHLAQHFQAVDPGNSDIQEHP